MSAAPPGTTPPAEPAADSQPPVAYSQPGERITGDPPDQTERLRIREDLERNFLVEAGAGSGKTTSLVDRMVPRAAAAASR